MEPIECGEIATPPPGETASGRIRLETSINLKWITHLAPNRIIRSAARYPPRVKRTKFKNRPRISFRSPSVRCTEEYVRREIARNREIVRRMYAVVVSLLSEGGTTGRRMPSIGFCSICVIRGYLRFWWPPKSINGSEYYWRITRWNVDVFPMPVRIYRHFRPRNMNCWNILKNSLPKWRTVKAVKLNRQ